MFLNPPPSKVDDLAKLFQPYITGEVYSRLKNDGIMPFCVVLNFTKIPDEEFVELAVYSLDKYFNLRWAYASSPDSDAVTFVFNDLVFRLAQAYSLKDLNVITCRCACHFHPGSYKCEPCSVCGHNNSEGEIVGGIVYGSWQKRT